jgi:hypothetical protein
MELSRILIREVNDLPLIELREVRELSPDEAAEMAEPSAQGGPQGPPSGPSVSQVEGGRSFPIVIGLPEAYAIERALKGTPVRRPQTHDLLASVIKALGGTLKAVAITDLTEGTFFAELVVQNAEGKTVRIDSRPSDAIAIGLGGGVPIYVEEHVLKAAKDDGQP